MLKPAFPMARASRPQGGVVLFESLVAMLIAMVGILGMASLTVKAASLSGHAQHRAEAGMFASQIVQTVALGVDRSSPEALQASLQGYSHQADGTLCEFSGTATQSNALAEVLKAARGGVANVWGLPGATDAMQQVAVDTTAGNRITVTLCWKGPHDQAPRNYQRHAFVN